MRTALGAAVLLAALASPVYAQLPPINLWHDKPAPTEDEIRRQKALDKAYHDAVGQVPAAKKADPWGNVRGAEQKPAKPPPKN